MIQQQSDSQACKIALDAVRSRPHSAEKVPTSAAGQDYSADEEIAGLKGTVAARDAKIKLLEDAVMKAKAEQGTLAQAKAEQGNIGRHDDLTQVTMQLSEARSSAIQHFISHYEELTADEEEDTEADKTDFDSKKKWINHNGYWGHFSKHIQMYIKNMAVAGKKPGQKALYHGAPARRLISIYDHFLQVLSMGYTINCRTWSSRVKAHVVRTSTATFSL